MRMLYSPGYSKENRFFENDRGLAEFIHDESLNKKAGEETTDCIFRCKKATLPEKSSHAGFSPTLDKMLRKAVKGKIDYIITKSISRVSRDTLEFLKIIRFLRERGINMHFENENLDSIRLDKEFEITLRSILALRGFRVLGKICCDGQSERSNLVSVKIVIA